MNQHTNEMNKSTLDKTIHFTLTLQLELILEKTNVSKDDQRK